MSARRTFLDVVRDQAGVITARHNANDDQLAVVNQTGTVWSQVPGTVCQAANEQFFVAALANPNIVAIIADERLLSRAGSPPSKPVLYTGATEAIFIQAHLAHIHAVQPQDPPFVHPDAFVHRTAFLDDGVVIGPGARIGPHVSIIGTTNIGAGVVVEPNAVIGADGLFAKTVDGRLTNMPHYGSVTVGRNAIVLAGAVIVRSAFFGSSTIIGDEAHVGVLTNVGHDATIGPRTVVSSNVVIAGRATIGSDCWIGASANIANAIRVGDRAQVKIGAVVIADVAPGAAVSGNFATDHRRNLLDFARRNATGKPGQ